jgi:hypothetical protein
MAMGMVDGSGCGDYDRWLAKIYGIFNYNLVAAFPLQIAIKLLQVLLIVAD